MKTRYALYCYRTENIGDEVQSIAARRFLPQIDYLIDRDSIGAWVNSHSDENVLLIANGWYMRDPFNWPPRDPSLNPLLVSLYIEPNGVGPHLTKPSDVFFSPESLTYLKTRGPVGARDYATLRLLRDHGVDSYFSGCLTLTLERSPEIPKQDFILAVDVSDEVYEHVVSHTSRHVIRASPFGDFALADHLRMTAGEVFLCAYQSAAAVITSRLHAALPCLALRTPVLLVKEPWSFDPNRYSGLGELVRSATPEEYVSDYQLFDPDNPPQNGTDYLELREHLIEICRAYTGYDSAEPFLSAPLQHLCADDTFVDLFFDSYSKRHRAMLFQWEVERKESVISDLEHKLTEQEARLVELRERLENTQQQQEQLRNNYDRIKRTSLRWVIHHLFHR